MPTAAALPNDPIELEQHALQQQALIDQLQQSNDALKSQVHSLLEALRLEKHRQFGASSEKGPDQTELFDEADAQSEHIDATPEAPKASGERRKSGARKPPPLDLPRIRKVIELSAEERQCHCGCELVEIGEQISEQVDIIPAQVQVIQTVRKQYACKSCEESMKTAPKPNVLLPKAIASANTMAYVITSKYADGIPLYRLSGILERYHIDLSRQTLSESVLKVAEKIQPLIEHLRHHLLGYPLLHMDETPVQVLKEPGRTAQSQSYMWVQRGGPPDKPTILFNYEPSRSGATASSLLSGYTGTLMTDGYTVYRAVTRANQLTHLCCWAHARRKFKEAQKAQPKGKTGKADMAINFIAKLYAVEKHTKDSDAATRLHSRRAKSVATLESFHTWLVKTQQQVPPKTALGKAVHYTLEYWQELTKYTENGDWPIDNNAAENAIRPFVIGRKNWLFSNSQRGATGSANLYSLIETAKANGREPYAYLSWLFEKLPNSSPCDIELLMPWNAPI
jgi:transposase